MNRTRLFATLLASIFVSAVGIGVAMGWDDRPIKQVAVVEVTPSTTTTTRPKTTTTRPTTTTTLPSTTTSTTEPPATTTTVARPVQTTAAPTTLAPATTVPPTTVPPTTAPPTTQPAGPPPYNAVVCAIINNRYTLNGTYDDPARIDELMMAGCPPSFWA